MAKKLQQGGVVLTTDGAEFAVWSSRATLLELCIYDMAGAETARLPMARDGDVHRIAVPGLREGARYGYRAHGPYDPDNGLWFDPAKLLADPYARIFDRPFVYDSRLGIFGEDTAALMPKAVVTADIAARREAPRFAPGGLIYEVAVKPFTILNTDVPEGRRGTVGALAHPAVIRHLKRIGVDAIELMPITAWIDERHLPPLGLTNGWGYNPVSFMALDPRLVPGGMTELRDTVAALHAEGIAVILDLVFNHTGESDREGSTLSLRGLDNLSFYRHVEGRPGELVNDTGTGNTVACDHPYIRQLIIDSLRHFVLQAGIDGFRFDLAPIIGRTAEGFQPHGETLSAMLADDVLADRVMIAEPWDIGPGGYQLGNFPAPFLEWNDRARDDTRRYWRGDQGMTGDLATLLAGSAPSFERDGRKQTRSVSFLAAHDGFTLMDLVSNTQKHNEANGENNRDGHSDNLSWNNGVEGETDDSEIITRRRTDVMAMLSTLFATRGSIMLTSGDEAGRSQRGNNNAYCQDNAITWVDWAAFDEELVSHTAFLADVRKRFVIFSQTDFLTDDDVAWLSLSAASMTVEQWQTPDLSTLTMVLNTVDRLDRKPARLAVVINRTHAEQTFTLPVSGDHPWRLLSAGSEAEVAGHISVPSRIVRFLVQRR
ncbi:MULTISPECIES: glycogen debranching protein GlgX [Rhizobium]|uniref:Glycogen debranching protein GlgX n=1 Tax=Rhizobium rhododendri TaxID=2506430 RepID=A0ABY8IF13_9HYPH|nr:MULTISPECIES: glycogen debranching protein GlgX [Rhizobium]MBZ5759126.1 glycogen debranching protein GlgX [Rhizobium sp. VS19-DR96]MBZ5764043.1 glycogen debranching protein GlgX [Rhizobium sp. VS19-DR129.2]MBZ5771587.1 glycogen debranching protein GlgX [Rhizobium sp. VS19-DRK62.2]MBZ5783726.1 glycogen debranching protein GlgX [Rhizobium sp. VS19-DR121]MBZ5801600.1 glycogen debranching protein GlgX [Rhizobium sp. VS19-DR181]